MLCKGQEPRYSVVPIPGASPAQWVEEFYKQSEQRTARCIELPDECYTMVTAQPDADEEWLNSLNQEKMAHLEENEKYARAGNPPLPFLLRLYPGPHTPNAQGAPGEGERFVPGENELEITCPRCAAIYRVTRENLED